MTGGTWTSTRYAALTDVGRKWPKEGTAKSLPYLVSP